MEHYLHPQGSTLVLNDDGSIVKRNKNGKIVSTSATAAALHNGHGGWVRVSGDDAPIDFSEVITNKSVPAGETVVRPMKFASVNPEDVEQYITDRDWAAQTKLDGVRSVLVFPGNGSSPWFRSGTGERLVSSVAAPVVRRVLDFFAGDKPFTDGDFFVDGEIVGGKFWVFDLVGHKNMDRPLLKRLETLRLWVESVKCPDIPMLSTARGEFDKRDLIERIRDACGEGVIFKRLDSGYEAGARVTHSLKYKFVSGCEAVVMERNTKGKQNMVVGLYNAEGSLVKVGNVSAIGKPDAQVGEVVEVQYLYFGAGSGLVQPTVLRMRPDKDPKSCTFGQLKYVNKEVVT